MSIRRFITRGVLILLAALFIVALVFFFIQALVVSDGAPVPRQPEIPQQLRFDG